MKRTLIIAMAVLAGAFLGFEAQAATQPPAKTPPQPQCRIMFYWDTPIFGRVCR
ncbi:MAG TPA: hypothetical protein VFA12_07750 [Stellaceae bacterium]|nr:hypothetical protein [Stellaceae bacterium]